MIKCGAQIHENLWRNLPSISRAFGINDAAGSMKGKPVIVAAAGPSLDKNVHFLKEVQSRYPIIAVDTALRTMQANGIEPDIIVSADPNMINCHHFIDTHALPSSILAYNPELFHAITSQWPYRQIYINLDKEEFTRWVETIIGPFGISAKGGSVGHTAFYLAQAMQADPIIFIGLDLAFESQRRLDPYQALRPQERAWNNTPRYSNRSFGGYQKHGRNSGTNCMGSRRHGRKSAYIPDYVHFYPTIYRRIYPGTKGKSLTPPREGHYCLAQMLCHCRKHCRHSQVVIINY